MPSAAVLPLNGDVLKGRIVALHGRADRNDLSGDRDYLACHPGTIVYTLSPIKRRPWSILPDGEGGSNQADTRGQRAPAQRGQGPLARRARGRRWHLPGAN